VAGILEPRSVKTVQAAFPAPQAPHAPAPPMSVPPGSAVLFSALAAPEHVPEGVVCLYFALTRPGMEGRELIGPCQGTWSPGLGAVLATHRRGERATCRHHDFFDSVLEGSMERAREQARVARAEGWLPPLLRLRVERSAASLLREQVPVWIESGFEAGVLGGGHRIEVLSSAGYWRVHSWVRYLDFAGVEIQRRFQLSLALGDGPRGDSLLQLKWDTD
jgi:hypothetical protein